MALEFLVQAQVAKPRGEVFDAVYNPDKLSKYFTTAGSGGALREGSKVIWRFADYPGDIAVSVGKVLPNELIVFEWAAEDAASGYNTRVEIAFESKTPTVTLVKITESGWRETPKGLTSSYNNCQGWMNMACCLKAWLEYGINLREGFF